VAGVTGAVTKSGGEVAGAVNRATGQAGSDSTGLLGGKGLGSSTQCDTSKAAAPMDLSPGEFPADPWNLKASKLGLHNAVFHGVVTVQTAGGPKRVLKFTAESVDIGNLQMSVKQGTQRQHVDGGPGTTSTMRGGMVTMYVESLTGTIANLEGLELPPILRVTLTPDLLPEWLWNLVGNLHAKLQLTLNDVDIDQAGQTGGNLTIPGMHGYATNL
jgi:hypothetical protein